MAMGVYDATGTCAGLVLIDSSNPNTLNLTGLTATTTYYIRVYGRLSSIQYNNFDICVGTTSTPPTNDDCSDATALTIGALFSDNPMDATVVNATVGSETASCGNNGPGVWYSIVVPADGNIVIETGPDTATGNTGFDSVIEAFSGSCGALVSIGCDDNGATTESFSILNLTGLTPSSTIFVRVWEFGGNAVEPFAISAYNATLSLENTIIEGFEYFPNPTNNNLTLRAQNSIQKVNIYNMLGQEVMEIMPNTISINVDISNLSVGAYFVKVTINNVTKTIRVVKM